MALLMALLMALAQASQAGPWQARTAQGLNVRIVQDSFRSRDAYVLDRVYPDGAVDTSFGQQGSTLFTLGPDNEGPAALRLDALGRIWVAGGSAGRGDTLQAVLLRFAPNGSADTSYAEGGRAATALAGRQARALDLAPQADGSAVVVGLVTDAQGQERSGWWRLTPEGRVDTRFGLGGLWLDSGQAPSELLDLNSGPDGSVALTLRRGQGSELTLEAWVLQPGSGAPVQLKLLAPEGGQALAWRDGQWRWSGKGSALVTAPTATAAPGQAPAAQAAPVVATPVPHEPVVAKPTPGLEATTPQASHDRWPFFGLGLAAMAVLVGLWRWLRQRQRSRNRD